MSDLPAPLVAQPLRAHPRLATPEDELRRLAAEALRDRDVTCGLVEAHLTPHGSAGSRCRDTRSGVPPRTERPAQSLAGREPAAATP